MLSLILCILGVIAAVLAAFSVRTGRINCVGLALAFYGLAYLLAGHSIGDVD